MGLSRRISHLQLADGQVIWPIGIPLKAVETDASGGVLMSLPIQSEMGGQWGPSGSVDVSLAEGGGFLFPYHLRPNNA